MEKETTQLMAEAIIKEYQEILPDHLGSMEYPIAQMCARKAVDIILKSNPQFTPYGIETPMSSLNWWKDVYSKI